MAFNVADYRDELLAILHGVINTPDFTERKLQHIMRQHPRDGKGFFSRDELIKGYRELSEEGAFDFDPAVVQRLQRKPTRTMSGVTPVTILTKPYPCPGKCIFCPNDIRMPKSYLSDEPGAMRAEQNSFDPYLQTYTRILAYDNIGHNTDKIEIIILGGTWSFYPEPYQIWFIKRIFDALHDFGKGIDRREEVEAALRSTRLHPDNPVFGEVKGLTLDRSYNQMVKLLYPDELDNPQLESATWEQLDAVFLENETASNRCVGLVIETRPDYLDEQEAIRLRRLGCTKIQIGIQSLNDEVLRLNKRGHTVQRTRDAIRALRQMGFKIHAHWMPNLYGSTPAEDVRDFQRLFSDPDVMPDELKVYPCSLIESAELMQYYKRGEWQPYTEDELRDVLVEAFRIAPPYVRLTRVIRDIPSTDIVVGNKKTNFREIVEKSLKEQGIYSKEIRSREIKKRDVTEADLRLDETRYQTSIGEEIFLQYVTSDYQIAGFLRLSLPTVPPLVAELEQAAMIREVHVYGKSVPIGENIEGKAQHLGLGRRLIERAAEIATERGYAKLAVISAIGTREYYRKRGFADGVLYQHQLLNGL